MDQPRNPLDTLDPKELIWLFGILKDACRERLEKNAVSLAFEERLHQRGPVPGRLDPRPFLKIWGPRYRKLLEVACQIHAGLEGKDSREMAKSLRAQFAAIPRRKPPAAVKQMTTRRNGARKAVADE